MKTYEYDAVIIGSGPNGLAAAITLQHAGLSVLLIEGKETIGGGLRTAEVTLPGFKHDICSAIHPLAAGSPFFQSLPLQEHGLTYLYPSLSTAHPFDGGRAAVLEKSLEQTAQQFGVDQQAYLNLMRSLVKNWPKLAPDVLGPLAFPKHPLDLADFGLKALPSAVQLAKRFKTEEARGLWAGMAAHSIQPLSNLTTSAIGLVLMATGHLRGWPIPKGGSQSIANALASYFEALGGKLETNSMISSTKQLPSSRVVLFDLTPRQLLQLDGLTFPYLYRKQLERYKYGMGVFKVDWALSGPIPFTSEACRQAGTLHLGNSLEEIAASEHLTSRGAHPEKPFVLLAQQSLFDPSRAPKGQHTAWAYCHVPHGSTVNMTAVIEKQVERFAPGFKDLILAKSVKNTTQMQAYNPNYIGGDINGGILDVTQLYTRPVLSLSPYRTPVKGVYLCSSSTPPGGGVHGMCGYHAAKIALKDVFHLKPTIALSAG